jgi:hypothetical protein
MVEKMRKIFIALQVSGLSQRTLVAAPQKFGGASAVNKQAFHCSWLARTLQNFAALCSKSEAARRM